GDEVVDDRRERADQDVLGGDVPDVLHARQPRLEEREAGLHEHDEHGGEDDRCRAGCDGKLVPRHPTSTSSSGMPVRLCMTWPTGVVHTSPSPDSYPLRAASVIAARTRSTRSSSTTNSSSAFGRKRDSKMRPRYSCVIPRCRPWPTASITVTPTCPVASSTASITVSMRSRMTTAS